MPFIGMTTVDIKKLLAGMDLHYSLTHSKGKVHARGCRLSTSASDLSGLLFQAIYRNWAQLCI